MNNKVSIANRAAQIVDEGWCQGTYENTKGNKCAVGALTKAVNEHVVATYPESYMTQRETFYVLKPAVEAKAREIIQRDFGYDKRYVQSWNDEFGRTKEEVVDLWERVAKEFSAEEE